MKVAGIIAEYNPFHRGHKYQLDRLRELAGPDYIIVAMSGDFLQRGTPALMDKYTRARMSLLQGADLILELPACYATSSAETFARGGILLLAATGLTDMLCFGAESDDLDRLRNLALLLNREPDWYRSALLSSLKKGRSFPAARAEALPEYADLLNQPNNILAVEYLKAMKDLAPAMEPLLIQRKGSGYHDTDITAPLASASAIRDTLLHTPRHCDTLLHTMPHCDTRSAINRTTSAPATIQSEIDWSALAEALPESSLKIMQEYEKDSAFLQEDDFSQLLHYCLLRETKESLAGYLDMTEDLANRIDSRKNDFISWSSFCQLCNTKDTTYARISRALTHILLNIRTEDHKPCLSASPRILPYLRVLGFRRSATPLLTQLKSCAKAPIITSPAAAEGQLTAQGLAMLHTDIHASDLYRCIATDKTGRAYLNEYQRKLLIVE